MDKKPKLTLWGQRAIGQCLCCADEMKQTHYDIVREQTADHWLCEECGLIITYLTPRTDWQERIEYDNEVASLRAGMEERIFASLWAEGREMTMDQAIEYALTAGA